MDNNLRSAVQFLATAPVVAVALVAYNWQAITSWQVRRDLRDYSQAIRHADCVLAQKEQLLDQVEALEDHLRKGQCIGWLRWRETDQVVRDLIEGGINSEKVRLIGRELRRLEREINQ
jgi:hypothetical protein